MRTSSELRTIVLADKLFNTDCSEKSIHYLKKQFSIILWNNLDILSIINTLKKNKSTFLRKLRKVDNEKLSSNEVEEKKNSMIFDYIENIFSQFWFNINLNSLYYNFDRGRINEFIEIFSRGLSFEALYEEKRILSKNSCILDKDRIHLPIHDVLSSDWTIWYITADITWYNKKQVFFVSNIIFNVLSDVIHNIFINKYENLIEDSLLDGMTWAFSREYWLQKIEDSLMKLPENFDIEFMFVDIDHFKNFNDTYWHEMWDKVLSIFIEAITKSIRKTDYVVRYWWEEFLIIFKLIKSQKENIFDHVKNDIDKNLKKLIKKYGLPENITFSWWTSKASSLLNENINQRIEDIIAIADKNMYKAKENWRNQIVLQNWKIIK